MSKSVNGRNFQRRVDTNNVDTNRLKSNTIKTSQINSSNVITGSLFSSYFNLSGAFIHEGNQTLTGDQVIVGDISRTGDTDLTGGFDLDGTLIFSNPQTITATGALSLTTIITYIDTSSSPIAPTLATGTSGQIKILSMTVSGNNCDCTNANCNLVSTIGNIRFNGVGQSAILLYTPVGWTVIGNFGVTIT